MSLFEIGRLVVKIAGRDAGKTGIVINQIDDNFVLIDGHTRRKKCNIKHLEILPQILKIKKDASHEEVKEEFKKIGLEIKDSKPKESKPSQGKIFKDGFLRIERQTKGRKGKGVMLVVGIDSEQHDLKKLAKTLLQKILQLL